MGLGGRLGLRTEGALCSGPCWQGPPPRLHGAPTHIPGGAGGEGGVSPHCTQPPPAPILLWDREGIWGHPPGVAPQ